MALLNLLFDPNRDKRTRRSSVMEKWKKNPHRLINALGMKSDLSGRGVLCPYCGSGAGSNGTGMHYYTSAKGNLRLKCFACDKNVSPVDLVMHALNLNDDQYDTALAHMEKLYADAAASALDDEPDAPIFAPRVRNAAPLRADAELMNTYRAAVASRESCPQWQQKVADQLGLPFAALNRPDLGNTDAAAPDRGDLAMFNLLDGTPRAVKVRQVAVGTTAMTTLNPRTNTFMPTILLHPSEGHAFRMAGASGQLCFGHDTISDQTAVVVIVEGQSDVLAVCSAAQQEELYPTVTCIGRDSSSHILTEPDLAAVAGKTVVYAEDHDTHGSLVNQKNIDLLRERGCRVRLWTAPADHKDPRAFYLGHGAAALLSSLLNAPEINS